MKNILKVALVLVLLIGTWLSAITLYYLLFSAVTEKPKPTYIPNYQPPNSTFYVELGLPYSIRAYGSKGPNGQYIYTLETQTPALFIDACEWDTLFHE